MASTNIPGLMTPQDFSKVQSVRSNSVSNIPVIPSKPPVFDQPTTLPTSSPAPNALPRSVKFAGHAFESCPAPSDLPLPEFAVRSASVPTRRPKSGKNKQNGYPNNNNNNNQSNNNNLNAHNGRNNAQNKSANNAHGRFPSAPPARTSTSNNSRPQQQSGRQSGSTRKGKQNVQPTQAAPIPAANSAATEELKRMLSLPISAPATPAHSASKTLASMSSSPPNTVPPQQPIMNADQASQHLRSLLFGAAPNNAQQSYNRPNELQDASQHLKQMLNVN